MSFSYVLDGQSQAGEPTSLDLVRLLINDVDESTAVFQDQEINAILALEGGVVKLAAARLIDTNAANEALASKVLRTQDLSTDGAKLALALRVFAQQLRDEHAATLEEGGFFDIIDPDEGCGPELAHNHRSWF